MKKLVSTLGMAKEEWLSYRKQGIGGSEAGAVCGLNPYRTPLQVYLDKTSGWAEDNDNEAMRQGRDLEEYVAKRFMEASGKKVRRANAMFYDPAHPFMLADVDRMVVGENAGLECKTASPYMEAKWADGKVPPHYLAQCYHYMSVTGADAWYIAVLVFGREFKFYRIDRDNQLVSNLIQLEQCFWENHVLKRVAPPPDGSKLDDPVIGDMFKDTSRMVVPLEGFDGKLQRRQELAEEISRMEVEKRRIEQELKMYMGDAEYAENENFRVSWKNVKSSRLDTKRLKAEEPLVYSKYCSVTSSRRLEVKAA